MPELIFGVAGLVIGAIGATGITWAIVRSREKERFAVELARLNTEHSSAFAKVQAQYAAAAAHFQQMRTKAIELKSENKSLAENLRKYEAHWAKVSTKLEERERSLSEQRTQLEQAETKLKDVFTSLAAQAWSTNNETFVALAESKFTVLKEAAEAKFNAIKDETTAVFDEKQNAIQSLVQPVSECLGKLQTETKEMEEKRLREIGAVSQQLQDVAANHALLAKETSKLVNALKSPQVRGRWGEVQLRKTVELAGMTPYCDFVEQQSVTTEDGTFRPDLTVRLPAGREVVVDSKVPLGGYLEAYESTTPETREIALAKHVTQVSDHVHSLAAKSYWARFEKAPEFVIMFIPNDSFLAAAAERDPDLIETALAKRVVIATPTTFVALLRAIEYGWRQQIAVDNAVQISFLGRELSDRYAMLVEHLKKIGSSLNKANDAYNAAVGSIESRILPMARKFRDLGAVGRKEIEELEMVESVQRNFADIDGDSQ